MRHILQALLLFSYGKLLVFSSAQDSDDYCNNGLNKTAQNYDQKPCRIKNTEKSNDNDVAEIFLSVGLIVGISSILLCVCCLTCKIISKTFENRRLNIQNPHLNIANRQIITKDTIEKEYPIEQYKNGTSIKGEPTCTICLVDFSEGENIRKTNCLHTFHSECLDEWLFSRYSPRCPNCNKILFGKENLIM